MVWLSISFRKRCQTSKFGAGPHKQNSQFHRSKIHKATKDGFRNVLRTATQLMFFKRDPHFHSSFHVTYFAKYHLVNMYQTSYFMQNSFD